MLDLDNLPDNGATPSGVAREDVGIDINMVPDRHSDTLRDLYRQSRTKPDEFAKVRKLAEQSGLPEVTVRNQPAEAERVVQEPDWYNLEQVSPKTVEQLVKNTKLFQQASDDTENLSWWERTLNATWRPAKRGLIGSLQGFDALQVSDAFEILDAIGKIESGEFKTDADIAKGTRFSSLLMGAARTPEGLTSLRKRMTTQVNDNMLEYLQRAQALRAKELQPTTGLRQFTEADSFGDAAAAAAANPSVVPELISQSLGALLPMAPAIVASGGAGGVGALAVSTGLSSMVTEYVNSFTEVFQEMGIDLADTGAARKAMASPEFAERMRAKGAKAAVIGLFDAATAGVAGTTLAPAKVGAKTLTKAQRQAINIPAQTGVQAAGGGAGEAAGSVAAGEEIRPGAVLAEMIAEAPGGVIDVAILALNRAGNDTAKAQEALEDAQRLEQLFNMAAQSKLRTRDPESFAQFVQQMAAGEGALSEVYIDAETLVEVLNQAGEEQGAFLGQMPSVAEQLQDAIATGNASVSIPVGELLGNLTGTGIEQALLPHLRTAPDALSLVEAQQASEQAQVYLQELANEVLQQANDAEAVRTSAETVKTTILDQLNTANRFTADVNETYANLVRDFYTATSARLGITPEEMYQRYPLRIRAEGVPSAETLQADGVDLRGVATPATVAEVQQMLRTYNSQSATVPISPEQRSQAEALLAPLVERATAAKADFDAAVSRIAEQFGLAPKLAPIKGIKRAAEKLVNETENLDVTQIRDMLRATIVVPNVEDVQAAVEQIGQSFEIVRIKDRFSRPAESGYRDVLVNVRTPEGVEAEIQVSVPAMLSAKQAGHKLYEMARGLPEGDPRRVRLEELQSRLYTEAFDSATNASNSAALTGTPYENTLAESGNGLAPAGPTATQLPSGSLATGTPSTSNNLASGGNSNISGTSDSIIADAETSNQVVLQESIDASLNSVAAPAQATLADFSPAMLPGLLDKQGWAVLTAEDPGATKATPEQNAIAMANLRADLEDMGADFIEVTGKYGDVQRAFIVTGISEEEAQALGNKYGQESVLTRRGLIYGDGAVTPATGMELYSSAPGDFYTEVPSTGAFFSVVLDFDATGEAFAQARRPSKLLGKPSTAAEQPAVELPQQLSETTAVDIRLGAPLTGRQGMSVAQVGLYFDGRTGPRDYNDPVEYQRALRTLITEVQFQLQQEKNGLDWYEEDIAAAFAETQTIIPELADPGQRQLFSVLAGILSPQTNARDNWFITAKAFSYYKQTGKVPGRNPETGSLWQGGTTSVNKEKALVMLDNMVQDIGEAAAIDWLMSEHTVKELNDARRQWGNMAPGVDGKMTDTALGLRAFGPKVGPFVMNINGIHEITVDMWATRTFNRYFGQMMGPDGKIVDAPTEPQRRVVKDLFNEAAEALNIKGYQVQSVIWFFEQQLFNQLGTGAQSYGFSDGARRFTGADLGNAGNVAGGQGAGGNAQASAVLNQSSTGTVNLTGVHFSKQPRTRLDGVYYGTGLKGLEADRLASSSDSRLKQRVYFYVDEGKGVRPEGGVGGFAHSAELTNLYDAKADPLRLWRGNINDIESRILDAGFSGYYIRDAFNQQGAAVVLGQASRSIPAQQIANPTTQAPARQAAPQQFRRGLLAREIDAIDLSAVQAVAPSANIRAGNFVVDMTELEAARGVLSAQGVELPGATLNQTGIPNERQTGNRAGRYASGGLAPLEGAPTVKGAAGPDPRLVAVAEQYARDNGIELRRQAEYVEVDPERAARIAAAYDAMPHAPQDPKVREAYTNLIAQTVAQYRALEAAGYRFYFFDESNDPYGGNPWDAMRDLRANQTMGVFATEAGFGSGATELNVDDNPLLADTGITWPYGSVNGEPKRVLANDLFRAVHDAFGHGLEGSGFRARGEENAWQAHVRLFTGSAVGAITTETRGQNSWLNYGPYGEKNRTAAVEDTVFADQKTGLLPEWVWSEGRVADAADTLDQTQSPEFKAWFGDSKAVDAEGKPLVVYHGTTKSFDVFSFEYGPAFFTDNASAAAEYTKYGKRTERGANVLPVYLSFQNPLIVDYEGASDADIVFDVERVKEEGYDSLIVKNADDGRSVINQYVAFNPTQIKSATGNRGTFDLNDPSILNQTARGADELTIQSGSLILPAELQAEIRSAIYSDDEGATVEVPIEYLGTHESAFMGASSNIALGRPSRTETPIEVWLQSDGRLLITDGNHRFVSAVMRGDRTVKVSPLGEGYSDIHAEINGSNSVHYNPSILKQPARGTFSPSKMELSLLKDADLSTFLHESGHFFLEVLADIATQPGAPADVQADMAAVMKWFGVADAQTWMGMTLDQKRPHHEKFAESFEQYLFEGKAPSPELKSMFRRFREFLTSVYTSLKEFARHYNTELNDEVRGVFDRLLATDAQIREAERQAGMTPDFDATNEAIEKLSARSLRDLKWVVNARSKMLKQLQRDIDGKRKAMREDVTLEIRRRPEYAVQRFLKFGELVNEEGTVEKVEGGKLSLPIMKEFYGEGPAAQWRYLPTNMVTADVDAGLHFNMVAELFGYRNGDEMVRAVLAAEPEASAIDGLTDQRLLETYGDLATPEGIERAANEAIHNEARARFVATQIKALREGMNQRERTAAGGSVNVIVRAAKEFAQNLVARRKVRNLKPGLFTAAEARAAKRGEELTMAGDTAGALTAKRDQLLNHYAAKYTMEAQSEVDKKLDYLRKFEKDSVRKKLPPEYLDQIDKLLERFDLRRGTSLRQLDRRASLLAWVENQRELGLDPAVPEELLDEATLRSYKDMTIEEFRGLVDTVRNIEHLGRLKDKLLTLQDQREFAAVVQELEASIRDNATKSREERINAPTRLDEAKDAVRAFFSMHRKLSSFVRQMDGLKDGGPFWNVLVRSMNAAADNEAVQREKATKQLSKIFEPLLKSNKLKQLAFIPAINRSLSLETRLAIAMNWGNETNRQRIMDGDKWSQQQVEAILATLTPEQLKFVQRVWDYIDSYWPDIRAKEERVSGVAPEKVQASAFTVRLLDGTEVEMAGGYYPIKYDPDRSSKAEADTAAEITKQMMQGQYTRATTRRGHTKARVDTVNRPVRKDMGVVFEHVTQVIHDLSWHEWLIDATRLLRSGPIDSAIRETMGPEVLRDMREAIKDIAAGEVPAQNQFEASINHLRNGTTIVGMGWNLMTALMQPLGLTQSMVRIGPKWVGKGIATMFGDATRMENSVRKIHEKSDFMRLRDQTLNREINEIRNKVRGEMTGPVAATYFYLIQKLQLVVDAPTWLGAYEKAIAQGADEAGAVALADQAVRDSQGAGQVSDLARIQRGSTLQKLFTNFYNYFNTTFNLTAERFNMTNFRNPLQVGRFMVDMLLLYTIPSVLATLLKEAVKGGSDDEDELVEKLIREQLNYLLGTMVGLRELGAAVNGFTGYEGPAGTRFFSEVAKLGKQVEQGELDEALLKRLNNAAGILFHYPAGAVNRAVEGYLAYAEGETDNPLAVIFGPPPQN